MKKVKKVKKIKDKSIDFLPKYDSKFDIVHEYVQCLDLQKEWSKIKDWLKQKPKTPAEICSMLNEQPGLALVAKGIYLLSENELRRFQVEWKDKTSILRGCARESLEEDRKTRKLTKQITVEMIEDWIIDNHGEKWKELMLRLNNMTHIVELLREMSELVKGRSADFRKMVK